MHPLVRVLAVGTLGMLALSACAGGGSSPGVGSEAVLSGSPSSLPPGRGALVLVLDFDQLAEGRQAAGTVVVDLSGHGHDAVVTFPPDVDEVPQPVAHPIGMGMSLEFPDPCDLGPDCLRAILEIANSADLNPSLSNFSFGVDVQLKSVDIRSGANLLQKGYSTGDGGQWKVQVDDKDGRPSCVLVDSIDGAFLDVLSSVSVSDDVWHTIVCERSGSELTVSVDGQVTGRSRADDVFLIDNDAPVRIAGKHVKENADYYFGQIDNVFLRVDGR